MQHSNVSRRVLILISFLSMAVFIAVWEVVCRLSLVDPIFLPAPSEVLNRGIHTFSNGTLWANVLASTRRVMIGFFMAVAVSIPLGMVLGTSRRFCAVFDRSEERRVGKGVLC